MRVPDESSLGREPQSRKAQLAPTDAHECRRVLAQRDPTVKHPPVAFVCAELLSSVLVPHSVPPLACDDHGQQPTDDDEHDRMQANAHETVALTLR